MEWQYDWDLQGHLPLQLELIMSFGARGEEIRHIFWIAPKQNPEVVLRQTLQSASQASGQTGGQTGTQPGNQPGGRPGSINIPAGNLPGVGGPGVPGGGNSNSRGR
jgi:hypothetical protein